MARRSKFWEHLACSPSLDTSCRLTTGVPADGSEAEEFGSPGATDGDVKKEFDDIL